MISDISVDPNHDDIDGNITADDNKYQLIAIGRKSYINQAYLDWGSTRVSIVIGRYTSIAHRVVFEIGTNYDDCEVMTYPFRDLEKKNVPGDEDINHFYENNHYQVIIGSDVWIGEGAKILGGVQIGDGAVIGMGAVVTKDIPSYAVAVGNPAKVVKYRFDEKIIDKLLQIRWWNWDEQTIENRLADMSDPSYFVDKYFSQTENKITPFTEAMDGMSQAGGKIYFFALDCDAYNPLWSKVICLFRKSFEKNTEQLLIIGVADKYKDKFVSEVEIIRQIASECQGIIIVDGDDEIEIIFPHIDVYVAGNTTESIGYIDKAEQYGVTVESGCDWESGLFGEYHNRELLGQSKPLVSVCIPTFNRSWYLQKTLDSIICQPEFESGLVEVVISDNCSSDDTEKIGTTYAEKYSMVRYFRNKKDIRGANFNLALARATGILRKLNNDTCINAQGSLEYLCRMATKYNDIKPVMYFGNRPSQEGDNDNLLDLRTFLLRESFHITWIASFAIWDEDCEGIEYEYKDGECLWQVRKIVEMAAKKKAVATCDKLIMAAVIANKNYSGKWLWKVFHDDYFDIIDPYITDFDKEYIEKDLLYHHFGEIKKESELCPESLKVDDDFDEELSSHYKYKPYWNDFCESYKQWHDQTFSQR